MHVPCYFCAHDGGIGERGGDPVLAFGELSLPAEELWERRLLTSFPVKGPCAVDLVCLLPLIFGCNKTLKMKEVVPIMNRLSLSPHSI